MSIAVLGAGAFGTALAVALAKDGTAITLWARDESHANEMQSARQNAARLPDVSLPPSLTATYKIEDVDKCDVVLLAVPMQKLRLVMAQFQQVLKSKTLVLCCKGIDLETGQRPSELASNLTDTFALLTGPSFAHDIGKGLPAALTLAAPNDALGVSLQARLGRPNLRLYRTTDVIGAEMGGALKNVIAIACGATIGAGLGDSARASLMTRGFAEIQRLSTALGAKPDTLSGLSGFGDLSLTCMSEGSRNFRFGLSLGRKNDFDPSTTVEGAATAQAALGLANALGVDVPITACVAGLVSNTLTVETAMEHLLSRPQKEE